MELQGVQDSFWDEIQPFGPQDMDVNLGPDGGSITRAYLVPWSMPWQAVAQQFLGYPYMATINGLATMQRHLPQAIEYLTEENPTDFDLDHSFAGFRGYMYAAGLKIRPLGGQGFLTSDDILKGFPQHYRDWKYAMFVVEYRTEAYDVYTYDDITAGAGVFPYTGGYFVPGPVNLRKSGGPVEANRFVDWQDEDQMKFAQVDKAAWVTYPNDNFAGGLKQSVGNKLGLPYAEGKVIMTWYDVDPDAFSVTHSNYLNGHSNRLKFFDYEPETLIYTGFRRRRRRGPLGNRTLNIEFTFIHRPNGANKFLNNSGVFSTVFFDGDTTGKIHPIDVGDYYNLFIPDLGDDGSF